MIVFPTMADGGRGMGKGSWKTKPHSAQFKSDFLFVIINFHIQITDGRVEVDDCLFLSSHRMYATPLILFGV